MNERKMFIIIINNRIREHMFPNYFNALLKVQSLSLVVQKTSFISLYTHQNFSPLQKERDHHKIMAMNSSIYLNLLEKHFFEGYNCQKTPAQY
jgi:hypothetical protein